MLSKSAVVSWERGYNGGSRQTLEIWYRRTNSDDYNWKTIRNIPEDLSSYAVYDIEPRQSYLFSMRGVNRMGFGIFGRIFRAAKFSSTIHQTANSKGNVAPYICISRSSVGQNSRDHRPIEVLPFISDAALLHMTNQNRFGVSSVVSVMLIFSGARTKSLWFGLTT